MNKRTIIASINKIADTLDNNGLYKEASSLTNVMRRLAQEEPAQQQTPQRLSPMDLRNEDIKYLMDPELDKKQFLMNARKNTYDFVNLVNGLLEESGYLNNPQMWETILTMISLYYSPDMLDVTDSKALEVLNNIWNEYNKFRDENIQQAYIDEELSAKSGIPKANEEQNDRVQEQASQLTALTLMLLKQKMRDSARMKAEYMPNTSLVEENIEPAYSTKYSPEKPGQ